MNQENQVPPKPNTTTKPTMGGHDLRRYSNLMPKTINEIAEVQARGRKLVVRRPHVRKDPYALQNSKPKTTEEIEIETIQRKKEISDYSKFIHYSSYYYDDTHEYRHVVLPKGLIKWLPHRGTLSEEECLSIGVTQSTGWEHYMVYAPEPHILLFKRKRGYMTKHGSENLRVRGEEEEKVPLEIQVPVPSEIIPVPSEVAPPIKRNIRLTRSTAK